MELLEVRERVVVGVGVLPLETQVPERVVGGKSDPVVQVAVRRPGEGRGRHERDRLVGLRSRVDRDEHVVERSAAVRPGRACVVQERCLPTLVVGKYGVLEQVVRTERDTGALVQLAIAPYLGITNVPWTESSGRATQVDQVAVDVPLRALVQAGEAEPGQCHGDDVVMDLRDGNRIARPFIESEGQSLVLQVVDPVVVEVDTLAFQEDVVGVEELAVVDLDSSVVRVAEQ